MPGRFEVLGYQPLVIVDGAHNPPGADTCAQVFFDDFQPEGRRILVVGTLREPTAMLEALRADEFDVVIACTAPVAARRAGARRRQGRRRARLRRGARRRHRRRGAARMAMRMADGDDAILAAGSLYVAGEARPALWPLALTPGRSVAGNHPFRAERHSGRWTPELAARRRWQPDRIVGQTAGSPVAWRPCPIARSSC